MKALVLVVGFLFSSLLFAQNYQCELVDQFDDWLINVDMKTKKVEFFDNDHWSTLKLVETKLLESHPPQMVHLFKGSDSMSESIKYSLSFNESKLTATLEDFYPEEEVKISRYEMTCSKQ